MRHLHTISLLASGISLCICVFLYNLPMERIEVRTIEIDDNMLTAKTLISLADTLQLVNPKCNTTSSVDRDVLIQHLSERYGPVSFSSIHTRNINFTPEEQNMSATCLSNALKDKDHSSSRFWGKDEHIRTTHHTYLRKRDVVMIEIGENIGDDATEFVKLYNPRFIILEPLEDYFNILKEKFKNNFRIAVVNVGLGNKNEVAMVNIDGVHADATSKFSGAYGKTPLYIMNATKFLMNLGVGLFEVDLLTINCEGCEYDVLETILSTTLINYFKNIQFATHSTLKGIKDPLERYCTIQELLQRTHRPTYQYRFIWESWRRKDL